MNTIRSSNLNCLALRVLLVVACVTAMLFQAAFPAKASTHWDHSVPGIETGIVQKGQVNMPGKDKHLGVTSSDSQGITLEFTTSDFTIEDKNVDGQTCQVIRIEDLGVIDTPGWPELPTQGAMVGIPAKSHPALTVIEAQPIVIKGKYQLCPVESPAPAQDTPDNPLPQVVRPARNPQAYNIAGFQPQAAAQLVSTAHLRDQRVAQVRLHPFQYNALSGDLRYFKRIVVHLAFNEKQATAKSASHLSPTGSADSAFEDVLQSVVVNYEQAEQWRSDSESTTMVQSAAQPAGQQPVYKLFIDQDGLYQVTYDALAAVAGVSLKPGQASNSFRLYTGGEFVGGREVAIDVLDGGDGNFDPGDAILFYGQKVDTKYTGVNVYYLTWGGAQGLRMVVKDSTPSGGYDHSSFRNIEHLEQNKQYLSNYPSGDTKDVWYWEYIQNSGLKTYTTMLSSIASAQANNARVRGMLRSLMGSPRHHTRIYLNGYLVDDTFWNIDTAYYFDKEVPQNYLVEGANTITVESLMDNGITSSFVLINWFEIEYWDAFVAENDALTFRTGGNGPTNPQITAFSTDQLDVLDVTDPNEPIRLVNVSIMADEQGYSLVFSGDASVEHVYIAQSQAKRLSPQKIERDTITALHSTTNAADYIIITHADFLAAAQSLVAWRASQGLRTFVVDVADVYDEFSGGLLSPQAIHDFLAYAYNNWQAPAPLYVLLFGDGNYDPRNYLGTGTPTYIPPYLEFVDLWMGENASENRFVTVSGNDNLPDMFIGRIPVNSQAQATAVVSKILTYEQNPPDTNWNSKVLFIADNMDSAGNFAYYSDKATRYLPAYYNPQKIYYGINYATVASAREAIQSGFNNGALIINYVGHGFPQFWASENLFSNNTVASLSNANKLPFVTSMSCLTSSFIYPNMNGVETSSLAEKLVLSTNGGAIATFASTGLGQASGQDYLNTGLFHAIFQENRTQIGPATTRAKLNLYASTGSYQDLIDIYTLLGDPATRLQVLPGPVASVGDRVWEDMNANGLQDVGEPGLPGVSVDLYTAGGNLVGNTVTDQQGNYSFENLSPGNYYLIFSALTGYTFSPQNTSAGSELDSDAEPTNGRSADFYLVVGQSDRSHDAGMFRVASVGDRVWEDMNANGLQDMGEPGLPGVAVDLYTAGGNLVGNTVTDQQGNYSFENLSPGNYYLIFSTLTGYAFSPQNTSVGSELDSDAEPTNGRSADFYLIVGQSDRSHDAGMFRLASVGDRVWEDMNANGLQDVGESGLPGVSVALYTGEGNLVSSIMTDSQGFYSFNNLMPGSYYFVYSLPDGYIFSPQNPSGGEELDSDADRANGKSVPFTLTLGQVDKSHDAGMFRMASLGDRVWEDKNDNGIQDSHEKGIKNIQVSLFTPDGTLVASTSTDRHGNYQFVNIEPGSYYLVFSLPRGYQFCPINDPSSDPGLDSDADLMGVTRIFTLLSGQQDFSWDAGLIRRKK
jgi:protocatechuate 3,4-dioxygenase beta subunit